MAASKGSGPQVIDISKLNLEQLTSLKNQLDQVDKINPGDDIYIARCVYICACVCEKIG